MNERAIQVQVKNDGASVFLLNFSLVRVIYNTAPEREGEEGYCF